MNRDQLTTLLKKEAENKCVEAINATEKDIAIKQSWQLLNAALDHYFNEPNKTMPVIEALLKKGAVASARSPGGLKQSALSRVKKSGDEDLLKLFQSYDTSKIGFKFIAILFKTIKSNRGQPDNDVRHKKLKRTYWHGQIFDLDRIKPVVQWSQKPYTEMPKEEIQLSVFNQTDELDVWSQVYIDAMVHAGEPKVINEDPGDYEQVEYVNKAYFSPLIGLLENLYLRANQSDQLAESLLADLVLYTQSLAAPDWEFDGDNPEFEQTANLVVAKCAFLCSKVADQTEGTSYLKIAQRRIALAAEYLHYELPYTTYVSTLSTYEKIAKENNDLAPFYRVIYRETSYSIYSYEDPDYHQDETIISSITATQDYQSWLSQNSAASLMNTAALPNLTTLKNYQMEANAVERKLKAEYFDTLNPGASEKEKTDFIKKHSYGTFSTEGQASEQDIADLERITGCSMPEELVDFYLNVGGMSGNMPALSFTIPDIKKLIQWLDPENPKWRRLNSIGIIDMICASWGNDRPEFTEEGGMPQNEIDYLNTRYKSFGYVQNNEDSEDYTYLYFDAEGNFGAVYYHQDQSSAWDDFLVPMLDKSLASRQLSQLLFGLVSEAQVPHGVIGFNVNLYNWAKQISQKQ